MGTVDLALKAWISAMAVWLAYIIYRGYAKDIDVEALLEQASVSATRQSEDESAVYRSVDVPHGMPLTTGLRIRRRESPYRTFDGNLQDCWELFKDSARPVAIDGKSIDHSTLIRQVEALAGAIKGLTNNYWVGYAGETLSETTLTVLLAVLFTGEFGLVKMTDKSCKDVDLVFATKDTAHGLADVTVVMVDNSADGLEPRTVNVSGLLSGATYSKTDLSREKSYLRPCLRQGGAEYSHGNFVSTVSSQLYALPMGHSWTPDDRVLVVFDPAQFGHFLTKLAMCFVSGSEILISTQGSLDGAIERLAPTIVCTTSYREPYTASALQTLARAFAGDGICTQIGDPWGRFRSLRLLYFTKTSVPRDAIRAKYGTRIVEETLHEGVLGPVFKTNLYDYRKLDKLRAKHCGVPSNCLEMKLKGDRLYVRGFSIGKTDTDAAADAVDEGWMPLSLRGRFGTDGCFYSIPSA